ncbi:MAG: NAD(P)/FAD-dependent oxidoreductase [Candidatus Goldbacteria bacterium]|nr:NAD(P)/FAD-dependent oxidoreductase [Candidatus Goldiibacteriota bacterium]
MKTNYDVIIIGSGIVGSLIARYLSRYELSILVIEKQADVGMCPSSANSAIIHAGYDPKPGSVKAVMNAEGNKIWHTLAPELGIMHKETGSCVAAIGEEELPALDELLENGRANKIPGLEIINGKDFIKQEPLINPLVSGVLWAPTAMVIDPFGAVLAAAENAVTNGAQYLFETEFTDFIFQDSKITGIKTNKGGFSCRWAINAAGLYSDEAAHKAGIRKDFKIIPRKGGYLVFDAAKFQINNVLFPVPSGLGKGTLVSVTTHANILIGPDNEPASDKEDTSTTDSGMAAIISGAKKLIPSIDERNAIAMYEGIRAKGSGDRDFIIERPESVNGFINICGIESPGFASAPAIALKAIELMKEGGENFKEKKSWNPVRKPFPHFHRMSMEEKAQLVKQNPAYGRIVCRCEEVTEGEIIDAIHSPVPARTYDGIKRRTWLGTGRCQGAFDYPRVIQILARELGIDETEITKKGKGSNLVFRRTKCL